MIIPYAPTLAWYRGDCGASALHPNRTLLGRDVALTVPLAGGGRTLKAIRRDAEAYGRASVSMHGNWPHVHLGASDAIYGRTPYFMHYFPQLERILSAPPADLAGLCGAVDSLIRTALRLDSLLPGLASPTGAVRDEAVRLSALCDPSLSMLDPLFRFGPEAIFLLVKTL